VNTWKVILATMVIFITGVVTGGLLVRFAEKEPAPVEHGAAPPRPNPPPGSPGWVRIDFLRRMQKELDLTADQRQRIDKLLRESQERTKKLMEPVAPSLHAEVQRAKEEFRDALTPEQRVRFDELVKLQQRPQKRSQPPHEHLPSIEMPTNASPKAVTNG
jgi:Spy/CpxP family protein refolding chaperone